MGVAVGCCWVEISSSIIRVRSVCGFDGLCKGVVTVGAMISGVGILSVSIVDVEG